MNVCFACVTNYNIFVSYLLSRTIYKKDEKVMIIHNSLENAELTYIRLKELDLYDKVIMIDEKFDSPVFIQNQVSKIDYETFDILHFFSWGTRYSCELFNKLKENTEIILTEEGILTSTVSEAYDDFIKNNIVDIKIDLNKIDKIYLFNKNLYNSRLNRPLVNIDLISYLEDKSILKMFCKELNYIFNYNYQEITNSDILFFDQYLSLQRLISDNDEVFILHMISKCLSNYKLTVKNHPRESIDKYSNLNFKLFKHTYVPWEVVKLNSILEGNDKPSIYMTYNSTALINNNILFSKFGSGDKLIFLHRIMKNYLLEQLNVYEYNSNLNIFESYLQKYMNEYKRENIFIPETFTDLGIILNKILSKDASEFIDNDVENYFTSIIEEKKEEIRWLRKYKNLEKKFFIQDIEQKDKELSKFVKENEKKEKLIKELSITEIKYKNEIQELKCMIEQKKIHICQLLEKERILKNIYQSDGWKLLLKYYRIRDIIFKPKSKFRLFIKLVYKAIKNPIQIAKQLNKDNINKFRIYLKSDDLSVLENKINNKLDIVKPIKNHLELFQDINIHEEIIFENEDNPVVSIIIPVYNQYRFTYSCLKSIHENTKGIKYEVIIADDVSSDETKKISDYIKNIRIIKNKKNLGFLLNCNNAAKEAKGKFILFLNNDTNVQKDWLKYLIDLIESDKKIGMVGSKLIYEDGRLQEAGGIIWNDASGWNYGRLDDPEKPEYNYVKEVDYISGASIMIRRDLWNAIGGFDERYVPAYCEDSDLAFEVRKKGYKVMYQPKSVVVHFEGISNGTDTNSGIKSYQVTNNKKFRKKWEKELSYHFKNGQSVFSARDRSKDKKTILVIDHYVPEYDKDAGSRTTFQYLKLFVRMGFNVKFLGDNFYRSEPYTSTLQQLGIEVLYGNWYRKNYEKLIKDNSYKIDFVYLNRPHISIKYIDFIRSNTKAKIIYYGHDLHYLRELREYEISKNEDILKSSKRWKEIEFDIINKSDVVYYPSQIEIDEIKKYFSNINAKAIPAYIFDDFTENDRKIEETKDLMFVGGFGHKPNIDGVLWFVKTIFPKVKDKIPNVKFYIIGSNPPNIIKELQSDSIIVKGFVSDEELDDFYKKCRLAVVPLRYGAGVKGKVVEAMYKQIPVITNYIGAEGLKNSAEALLIAKDEIDFVNEIINNYYNIKTLKQKSEKSIQYIMSYFSIGSAMDVIKSDFEITNAFKE